MTGELPVLIDADLYKNNALAMVTERVAGLLDNEAPAFLILGAGDVNRIKPPVDSPDKFLITQALARLGYTSTYRHKWPTWSKTSFGGGPDEGFHLDDEVETLNGAAAAFPKGCETMVLRRHIGAVASAKVKLSYPKLNAENPEEPLFLPQTGNKPFSTLQRPGDRIFFVSVGGFIGQKLVKPACHDFVTVGDRQRRANFGDYLFKPVETSA